MLCTMTLALSTAADNRLTGQQAAHLAIHVPLGPVPACEPARGARGSGTRLHQCRHQSTNCHMPQGAHTGALGTSY